MTRSLSPFATSIVITRSSAKNRLIAAAAITPSRHDGPWLTTCIVRRSGRDIIYPAYWIASRQAMRDSMFRASRQFYCLLIGRVRTMENFPSRATVTCDEVRDAGVFGVQRLY